VNFHFRIWGFRASIFCYARGKWTIKVFNDWSLSRFLGIHHPVAGNTVVLTTGRARFRKDVYVNFVLEEEVGWWGFASATAASFLLWTIFDEMVLGTALLTCHLFTIWTNRVSFPTETSAGSTGSFLAFELSALVHAVL